LYVVHAKEVNKSDKLLDTRKREKITNESEKKRSGSEKVKMLLF